MEKKREVTYAKTHSDIFIPTIGSLTQTLPPMNKNVNCKMFWTAQGLLVQASFSGRKAEAIIPEANVVLAVLAPEENVS